MRAFAVSFIVALVLLTGLCWWLWKSAKELPQGSLARKAGEALQKPEEEIPARPPEDYHLLQGQGGVPLPQAEKAGLITANHAYLYALNPIMISDGVSKTGGLVVRGLHYDMCFNFGAETPEDAQHLEFNINGNWHELHFGFGFEDSHPSDPDNRWKIELTINGDGKELFPAQQISPVDDPFFTRLDLRGVNRLTITARRIGASNPFKPVLLDPFMLRLPENVADEAPAEQ